MVAVDNCVSTTITGHTASNYTGYAALVSDTLVCNIVSTTDAHIRWSRVLGHKYPDVPEGLRDYLFMVCLELGLYVYNVSTPDYEVDYYNLLEFEFDHIAVDGEVPGFPADITDAMTLILGLIYMTIKQLLSLIPNPENRQLIPLSWNGTREFMVGTMNTLLPMEDVYA